MNLFTDYLTDIKKKISKDKDLAKITSFKNLDDIIMEKPPENFDFDLSSNIALILGKKNNVDPREIAKKIKNILSKEFDDFLHKEITYDKLDMFCVGFFIRPYAATNLREYHGFVIATGIFISLFLTLLAMRSKRKWPSVLMFMITAIFIVLLLMHHATEDLGLSF